MRRGGRVIFGDLVCLVTADIQDHSILRLPRAGKACEAVEKLVGARVGYQIWRSFGAISVKVRNWAVAFVQSCGLRRQPPTHQRVRDESGVCAD